MIINNTFVNSFNQISNNVTAMRESLTSPILNATAQMRKMTKVSQACNSWANVAAKMRKMTSNLTAINQSYNLLADAYKPMNNYMTMMRASIASPILNTNEKMNEMTCSISRMSKIQVSPGFSAAAKMTFNLTAINQMNHLMKPTLGQNTAFVKQEEKINTLRNLLAGQNTAFEMLAKQKSSSMEKLFTIGNIANIDSYCYINDYCQYFDVVADIAIGQISSDDVINVPNDISNATKSISEENACEVYENLIGPRYVNKRSIKNAINKDCVPYLFMIAIGLMTCYAVVVEKEYLLQFKYFIIHHLVHTTGIKEISIGDLWVAICECTNVLSIIKCISEFFHKTSEYISNCDVEPVYDIETKEKIGYIIKKGQIVSCICKKKKWLNVKWVEYGREMSGWVKKEDFKKSK